MSINIQEKLRNNFPKLYPNKDIKNSNKKTVGLDFFNSPEQSNKEQPNDEKIAKDSFSEIEKSSEIKKVVEEAKPKKTIDELQFDKVLCDGDSKLIYQIGPFSKETLIRVLIESNKLDIPVCILQQKSFVKKEFTQKEQKKQEEIIENLKKVYSELSEIADKKGNHKKQFHALAEERKKLGKELGQLADQKNIYEYFVFINVSRSDFIMTIKKCAYPQDVQIIQVHEEIEKRPELGTVNQLFSKDSFHSNNEGNYGLLTAFHFDKEDYLEAHISTALYYAMRSMKNSDEDHLAIRNKDVEPICLRFKSDRLIDYIFYISRVKPIHEEVCVNYIHSDHEKYKAIDFIKPIEKEEENIFSWSMPLSFQKLNEILKFCEKNNVRVSYQIHLPAIDLKNRENLNQIKIFVRADMCLNPQLEKKQK